MPGFGLSYESGHRSRLVILGSCSQNNGRVLALLICFVSAKFGKAMPGAPLQPMTGDRSLAGLVVYFIE